MILTEASVLHYLVARGFARCDAVTGGAWAVRNRGSRNRNFQVATGVRDLLVKQARDWTSDGRDTIEREAAFARRVQTAPEFAALRPLMPAAYSYDPRDSVLIFDFLPGRETLADSKLLFSPAAARLAGETLAAFHRAMAAPALADSFPGELPGFLSMPHWDARRLSGRTEGQRELVHLVQRHTAFADALDALAATWHPSALVHGDCKLENLLISPDAASLRIIDWELAGWGDPLWDAATLLQSWWGRWVQDPAAQPIEEIRPALHAFLDAYPAPAPALFAWAGGRMLQTAWEALQSSREMVGEAVRLAQASLHILTRPDWARDQLLGHD
jgi:aminoglycoside phosphotransferase (APT) family kinase protein